MSAAKWCLELHLGPENRVVEEREAVDRRHVGLVDAECVALAAVGSAGPGLTFTAGRGTLDLVDANATCSTPAANIHGMMIKPAAFSVEAQTVQQPKLPNRLSLPTLAFCPAQSPPQP
jgi:hypothetical protein